VPTKQLELKTKKQNRNGSGCLQRIISALTALAELKDLAKPNLARNVRLEF
jgi:hypothetical protein